MPIPHIQYHSRIARKNDLSFFTQNINILSLYFDYLYLSGLTLHVLRIRSFGLIRINNFIIGPTHLSNLDSP